jgi:hypothetical protein
MPVHNWMSSINDDRLLSEITMPGSHDAGIHADVAEKQGIAPERFAITQDVGIYEQCMRGSRFFDVRVDTRTGQGPGGQTYHGGKQTGAVGQSLDDTLLEVRRFLSTYGRECVILRFSKTKGNVVEVVNRVQSILGPGAAGIDLLYRTNTIIAEQKISALRLKAICVFEETHDAIKATNGLHRFWRYDGPPVPSGLVACGKYSNSSRIREVVNGQVTKIDEHANHVPNNHLFVLYWTQTFNVLRPWKQGFTMDIRKVSFKPPNFQKEQQRRRITGGAHHNMDYLKRLVSMGTDARSGQQKTTVVVTTAADRRRIMPNVIMYDFVNAQMSNEIVSLNDPALRGHVVEDEYEGVAQLFA